MSLAVYAPLPTPAWRHSPCVSGGRLNAPLRSQQRAAATVCIATALTDLSEDKQTPSGPQRYEIEQVFPCLRNDSEAEQQRRSRDARIDFTGIYVGCRAALSRDGKSVEAHPTWKSLNLPCPEAELSLTAEIARQLPLNHLQDGQHALRGPSRCMQRLMDAADAAVLHAATVEGQAARVQLLRGAVIVFVILSYSGKRWIMERAAELGIRAVVLDGAGSWAADLIAEGVIQRFVPVDFRDAGNAFYACRAAIEAVQQELGPVDGICSFAEAGTPLAAALAEAFGLPGNAAAAVAGTCDKAEMRKRLAAAGRPAGRRCIVRTAAQLREAAQLVGFPAVLKPALGSGSDNVVRVNSLLELEAQYASLARYASLAQDATPPLYARDGGGSGSGAAEGAAGLPRMLLEEFFDGPEVDVELVMSGGVPVFGSVTDSWGVTPPWFMETGCNIPSALPRHRQAALLQAAVDCVTALGLQQGAMDVEMRLTAGGPRIIEVNARMAGGAFRLMNLLVWGVDLLEEHLLAVCGLPNAPAPAAAPRTCLAQLSVNAPRSGTLQPLDCLEEWQGHPDVIYAHPLVMPGGRVTGAADGQPSFVAEVLVEGPTVEETIRLASHIEATLRIPVV